MRRVANRGVLTLVSLASVLAFAATGVQARTTPVMPRKTIVITGGQATVTPTTTTKRFLVKQSIAVSAVAPATLSSGTVTFPVEAGVLTDRKLQGALSLKGGLSFVRGEVTVTLSHLVVTRFGHHTTLSGLINGRPIIIARLTDLSASWSDKTATVTGELRLTRDAARAIDRRFGKHLVRAGYELGSFSSTLDYHS